MILLQVPVFTIGDGKLVDFERVKISDWSDTHIGWMSSRPFIIVGCSVAMEKVRPAFTMFAYEFNKDYTAQGRRGRAYDGLIPRVQTLFEDIVKSNLVFSSATTPAKHNEIMIAGLGGPAIPPVCRSPEMLEVLGTQFWGASSQFEIQATEKCFFGSLRLSFVGERCVAAVHLPMLIAFISGSKKAEATEKAPAEPADVADPLVASLADVPKVTMAECKTWLRNLTQDMLYINLLCAFERSMSSVVVLCSASPREPQVLLFTPARSHNRWRFIN